MEKYEVLCMNSKYLIKADNWCVGIDGLKFYQQEEIVAWFTTWDYWKVLNNET
jgi:hypothetical protein